MDNVEGSEWVVVMAMLAHILVCPGNKVEESFNIQATHDLLFLRNLTEVRESWELRRDFRRILRISKVRNIPYSWRRVIFSFPSNSTKSQFQHLFFDNNSSVKRGRHWAVSGKILLLFLNSQFVSSSSFQCFFFISFPVRPPRLSRRRSPHVRRSALPDNCLLPVQLDSLVHEHA